MKSAKYLAVLLVVLSGCYDARELSIPEITGISGTVADSGTVKFLEDANKLLEEDHLNITQGKQAQSIKKKRTYVSLACYWWPYPESEDGLPYIRRDGEVNPETRTDKSDLTRLIDMAKRVETLTAAYMITGNNSFAEAASEQLYTWFADSELGMLPHLEHAQMIKGRNRGRSYGVIDTWWLVRVVDSAEILKQSQAWTEELDSGLKAWFTHYLNWLRNSEFGKKEKESKNNHGTWYDLQILTFSLFTGQEEFAREYIIDTFQRRVSQQVTRSGRQKYETRRTRPAHYSIYNLNGLLRLAVYAEMLAPDHTFESRFLNGDPERAVRYLVKMVDGTDPIELKTPYDRTDTDILYYRLLFEASTLFDREEYKHHAFYRIQRELPDNPGLIKAVLFSGNYDQLHY